MTLRRRIVVIMVVALLVACAAVSHVVGSLLAGRHREFEEAAMRRDLRQAEDAVGARLVMLQMNAAEWASWEPSSAFLADRDAAFLDRQFSPETLSGMRLSLVAFFDPAGEALAVRDTDGRGADLAQALSRAIATRQGREAGGRATAFSGVMEIDDQLSLAAVSPVAPAAGSGSVRGFLALARRVEGRELEAIGEPVGGRVVIGHRSLSLAPGEEVIRFSDTLVEGYALLPGLVGEDEMVLEVKRSREPLLHRFPAGPIIAIAAIMALCAGVSLLLVDRLVLARLARLASEVAPAGQGGGDELDILATKLSGTLDELHRFTADLRESEARWRTMVESAPMAIGVAVEGKVRFLNDAGLKILALASLDDILGKPILEFVHPDYRAIVGERIGRVVVSGFVVPTIEEQFIRADGQQITVGVTAAPVTYDGSPAVLVMFRDVSARKRADEELARYREQLELMVGERTSSLTVANERLLREVKERERAEGALRESEELYRTLVAASPLAVAMTDTAGRTIFASERALALLGYRGADEIVGRQSRETLFPEDRERAAILMRRLYTEKVVRDEVRLLHIDGSPVPVEVNMSLALDADGRPSAVVATFADITERKEVERRLRESEELYRTLVETAPVAVAMTDPAGKILFASQRLVTLLGHERPEELIGRSCLESVAPGDREAASGHFGATASLSGSPREEILLLRVDGTTVPVVLHAGLVTDEAGNPTAVVATFLDISKRRAAEELYRTLVETAPIGVGMTDLSGRVIFSSERMVRLLGYRDEREIVGKDFLSMLAAEERETAMAGFSRFLAGEAVDPNVMTFFRADGVVLEGEVRLGLVRDSSGAPRAVVTTFADVTERMRVQRERDLAGERLAALEVLGQMAGASDRELADFAVEEAVRLTGSTVGYLAFSDEAEGTIEMYIWSKQAMAECATSETPLVYRLEETGLWGEAIRQGRPVITNDYTAPNPLKKGVPEGHVPIIRHMNVPVRDEGKIVLVAGVANKPEVYDDEDVRQLGLLMDGMWRLMESRRSRRALQDSEERNRAIVENAPIGVLIHRAGTLLYNNELSETLFGYGGETGVHGMAIMGRIHPDDMPMVEQRKRQRREDDGAASDSYTVRLICQDGAMKHVRVGVGPIRYRGETATMVTLTDVTDRVRAEEGLRKALERLEVQNMELTRLDRLKDGLVRDVTHELKTPVAKLRMQLELLEEAIARCGEAEATAPAILVMRESLLRQESVIRNILNLARLESGGRRYALAPARVDTLVEEVVADFRFALEAHGITVEKDLGPVVATTDKEMLSHVFSNLLGNAIKYRSHDLSPAIFLGMRVAGEQLVVTVMDNGIGMTREEMARAFDRFWQASAAAEGAGVGLSIAQRVVTDLGGTIELSSRGKNMGTVATVTLPMDGTIGKSSGEEG